MHEIARHEVGRTDVHAHVVTLAEDEDATVLEELAHDAAHVDVVRLALDTRKHAADAADVHAHLHAGLRCPGKAIDDVAFGERVALERDASGRALGDLAVDELEDGALDGHRSDEQPAIVAIQVADEHVLEEGDGVASDFGIRGEQAQVRVEASRLLVVVASADLRNVGHAVTGAFGDEAHLGMALVVLHAVDDVATCLLEPARPVDVVRLVETRAQLHEDGDLLAVFGRLRQMLRNARFARQAVHRDLDGEHVRIGRRLLQHAQEGIDRIVGEEEQAVSFLDLLDNGATEVELLGCARNEGGIAERTTLLDAHAALQTEGPVEVDGRIVAIHLLLGELKALEQAGDEELLRLSLDLEAHGIETIALLEQPRDVQTVVALVIRELLLVEADVGIARDRDDARFGSLVDIEDLLDVMGNELLGTHEMQRLVRIADDGRDVVGDGNDAEMLTAVLLAQKRRDVEFLVAKVREGMAFVDDLRGEDGTNALAIVIAGKLALLLGELVELELLEAMLLEVSDDLRVDLVALLDKRPDRCENGLELLAWRHVGLVLADVGRDDGEVHQTADAHHEELVEVRAEDADELESLEQRDARIEGLLEDAPVKLEPGKLAVLRVRVIEFLGFPGSLRMPVLGNDVGRIPVVLDFANPIVRIDYRFLRGDNLVDCLDFLGRVFGHGLLHANSPLISLAF